MKKLLRNLVLAGTALALAALFAGPLAAQSYYSAPTTAPGSPQPTPGVSGANPGSQYYTPQTTTPGTSYGTQYPTTGGYYNPNQGQGRTWYYDYYGQRPTQMRSGQQYSGQQGNEETTGWQQVRGEVQQTKKVMSNNTQYLAALVETADGRQVVVDLGPWQDLRNEDIRIRSGEEIRVRGRWANVGEHRVFMAHELRADGQRVDITRRNQQPSEQRLRQEDQLRTQSARNFRTGEETQEDFGRQGNRAGLQFEQFNGQILNTREVRLPEMNEQFLFAQIETDQGKKVLAFLGPVEELNQVHFNRGEHISLKGFTIRLDGRPLILAQHLRAGGQTFDVAGQSHEQLLQRSAEVKGKIIRTKEIDLPGMKREVLVAVVRADDGQKYIVGLGTTQDMGNLELNKGDQVWVKGPDFQLRNQRILLARQLKCNGQTVNLGESNQENQK